MTDAPHHSAQVDLSFIQNDRSYRLSAIAPTHIVFRDSPVEMGRGEVVMTVDGNTQRWPVLLLERPVVGEPVAIQDA